MFSCVFSLDNFLLKVLPKNSIFAVLWEEEGFTKDIFHDSVFKQGLGNVLQYTCYPTQVLIKGFVKSTDQQPSDYRPTNHQPFTHRSTDLIMITKRLGNSKTFISRNTNAARNVFRSICCLMNNICSQNLKCLQKNVVSHKTHTEALMLILKVLNITVSLLPLYFKFLLCAWKCLSLNAFSGYSNSLL